MYIHNAILFIALVTRINAYPWTRRQDETAPIIIGPPIPENVTTVYLPDDILSSDLPTGLQNKTVPTPLENSTIVNGDQVIVLPGNVTTSDTADNGTVSSITSTDNGTVVVSDTNDNTRQFFRPGTYDSAPGVLDPPAIAYDDTNGGFGLTGGADLPDYVAALSDAAVQPAIPDVTGCLYAWQSVLGGATGTKGGLWVIGDYVGLTSANVKQGLIGNCGMGGAIMSLTGNGFGLESWTQYLVKTVSYTISDLQGIRQLAFRFKYPAKEALVMIDDQLPTLTSTGGSCMPYLGFQPTLAAVHQADDGSWPPNNVFFVSLLEKAFAKYIDAFPELRSANATKNKWTGYKGLEGMDPATVLAAFTGGTPRHLTRDLKDLAPIILQLLSCIADDVICAVDTYEAGTLDGMGPKDEHGVVRLLDNAGWASPNTAWNQTLSYSLIDWDNVNDEGKAKLVQMIGNHAYGIDRKATTYPGLVSLLNPWGCNPVWEDKQGGCWSEEAKNGGPKVELSLRVYASMLRAVYWVEKPIPLERL